MKKQTKKILALILSVILLCSVMPFSRISVSAAVHNGNCGEQLNWTLDTETGELSITGTGRMDDY